MGGHAFIASLAGLDKEAREAAVLRELKAGNIPSFLRRLTPVTVKSGNDTATFDAMPDYLAIGSDLDSVRMPMNPYTAQAFCDAFGLALPTRKMSNDIWTAAAVKLIPQPLTKRSRSGGNVRRASRFDRTTSCKRSTRQHMGRHQERRGDQQATH